MTDAEIIKALECCTGHHRGCNTCAYYGRERPCTQRLEADALKLIRRQQTEINHFAEANKMVVETDKTEDEILKRLLTQRVEFIPNSQDVEDIKREAVREFAERLNARFENFAKMVYYGTTYTIVGKGVVNRVVNEMFGNPEEIK